MVRQRKTRTFLLFLLSLVFLLFIYIQTSNVKLNSYIQTGQSNQICTCAKNSSHRITPTQTGNMSEEFQNVRTLSTIKPTINSQGTRVIIVAHGRSGSSFLGGVFNSHPDFFFIYEPLNQLKKVVGRLSKEYLFKAEDVVHSILNCNFTDDAFLQVLSRHGIYRASSRPLVSPPFCKTWHDKASNFLSRINWKLCNKKISAGVVNEMCGKHKNVATKILLECLEPADLTWLVETNGSSSINVLYLVRDPRATLYSRKNLGWVVPKRRFIQSLANGEVGEEVRKVCDAMEVNLGAVLLQPQNIKLIRYEDLVTNPEEIVRDLFSELRISMSADVFRWIHDKTHGPVKLSSLSLSRKANVSINAWRKKIDSQFLQIIETRCARVLNYLGYIPTQGSQRLLRDLSMPLYSKEMKDLKETYQW